MLGELKTFKISNGALKSPSLPNRLKIFGWGENDSIDGKYLAGNKTASVLSANQRAGGYERVAIDFDHCSVPGTETNKALTSAGQPPLIFGYGRVNPVPGDGVYLEEIAWTPLGMQHAKNFEDISPAAKFDDNREMTLIHSVALTPNGKVTGLQFFSATQNQIPMNKEDYISVAELGPVFGLSAAAKKEVVLAKLAVLSLISGIVGIEDNKIVTLGKCEIKDGKLALPDISTLSSRLQKLEEAGNKNITTLSATIDGVVKTFSAEDLVKVLSEVESLKTRFTTRETAETDAERSRIIKLFAADGKVPKKADGGNFSAEEMGKMDVPTLKLLHANTPVTVPLSARSLTAQTDGAQKKYRDDKGKVDMAAIFNDENERSGQQRPAMV